MFACAGFWSTAGIHGGEAELCAAGWHLCGYEEMQGVDTEQCQGIDGFYGTSISSWGGWRCTSNGQGYNDIWGCGNNCHNPNAHCGGVKCAIGNSNGFGFSGLHDGFNEKRNIWRPNDANADTGGVMCCRACKPALAEGVTNSGPVLIDAALRLSHVVSSGAANAPVEVERVKGTSVKYATNRANYVIEGLGSLYGASYIRGDNDKGTGDQAFTANMPVTVVVAMDGRYDTDAAAPAGFSKTGESLVFDHSPGHAGDRHPMPLYAKDFDSGSVTFHFRKRDMAGIFVTKKV